MFKKGEFSPKKISGQNVQKFNMTAGARGAKIREGPQCPSYATAGDYRALIVIDIFRFYITSSTIGII